MLISASFYRRFVAPLFFISKQIDDARHRHFHFRRDVVGQQRKDNASIPFRRVLGCTCTAIKQFLRIFIGKTRPRSRGCPYRENYNSYPCGWREVGSAKRVRRIEWDASTVSQRERETERKREREREREKEGATKGNKME